MKTYKGVRLNEGCEVYVIEDGKERPLAARNDIRNHSPDGFEWGYGGSGPAQLALAILADHFGPAPFPDRCPFCECLMDGESWQCTTEGCGYNGEKEGDAWKHIQNRELAHYQDFKSEVISKLPKSGFSLTSEQIQDWHAAADRK